MNEQSQIFTGHIIDIPEKRIFTGKLYVEKGYIKKIEPTDEPVDEVYILPGLVDSHIHIESSMLSPQQFSRTAIRHGTVGTVSDPHEIANVLGEEGIRYMLKNAENAPVKFNFGVPSCVPATAFETSGAILDSNKVKQLLAEPEFKYLAEMMNFPGVVGEDPEVMSKLQAAHEVGKPVDGHAPGLQGKDLEKYIQSGITTDHECNTYEEAREKLDKGMKIQVREGSAARNFDLLWPLIREFPNRVMLCSDDRHPHDLVKGHINVLIQKGQEYGLDLFDLLKVATWNPVEHYNLDIGLLRENDPADFILVDDLKKFHVVGTYINGQCFLENDQVHFEVEKDDSPNVMKAQPISEVDVQLKAKEENPVRVIQATDHELYTTSTTAMPREEHGLLCSDTDHDVLKVAVINRYKSQKPALGFIQNFGLKKGAMGTSIAHDSHNLIIVGTDDHSIVKVANQLILQSGGIVLFDREQLHSLVLEIGGLMTHQPAEEIAGQYTELTQKAYELGCRLEAPFMTLSFMALPVIPELKITDQGLFDVQNFQYISLFVKQ